MSTRRKLSQKTVIWSWMATEFIIQMMFSYIIVFTMLIVYKDLDVTSNSFVAVLGASCALIGATTMGAVRVRRFVLRHFVAVYVFGFALDGMTECFLLIQPVWKYIMDVIIQYWWMTVMSVLLAEQREIILPDAEQRVTVRISLNRYGSAGRLLGTVASVWFQFNVESVAIITMWSVATCAVYYAIMCIGSIICDRYVKENKLTYPCMEPSDD